MEDIEDKEEYALEYLSQILVEAFLKQKDYEPMDWLYGERKWKKPDKTTEKKVGLTYKYVESEEDLNKAFDILFEETLRIRKEKRDMIKTAESHKSDI